MPILTVDRNADGLRLDKFLRTVLRGMPLSHIYKLLRTRKVRVNGKRAKADRVLAGGDRVLVHMSTDQFSQDTRRPKRAAPGMDFGVMYEDEHLLVVAKPPFLPVHPGAGHEGNSLIDQVHAYLEVQNTPGAFRPALAHRLDRDTSGLLLIGKSAMALRRLNRMLHTGEIEKHYLALVLGAPQPKSGQWELDVVRRDRPGFARNEPRGRADKPGRTAYRVAIERQIKDSSKGTRIVSLVVLHLLTGRTHQIRSHLFQVGHPIAGDPRYGDSDFNQLMSEKYNLRRQFLHAFRLELTHPVTNRKLQLVAPYPADLEPLVSRLKLGIPAV
jgi:23S rRNA pseudouridine955/2504/2580 synthase